MKELNFSPEDLPLELKRHYIPASEDDEQAMLKFVDAKSHKDLFSSIPSEVLFDSPPDLPEELEYQELKDQFIAISQRNRERLCFLGDALPIYKVHSIVPFVSAIRNLTTSYTPYQPERSQGTLISHWIYQSIISMITGFEAINSSLYDRSTALFEAICCAIRLNKEDADTVLISEGIFPQDIEVINTLIENTSIKVEYLALNEKTGLTDLKKAEEKIKKLENRLAGLVFAQVNHLGLIEDVDKLTDLAAKHEIKSIASIDPMQLAIGGLKPPSEFGKAGANIIIGEGQHLAIGPNFGGPGLGIFGVRYNKEVSNDVRATPGRFVGKAKDIKGRDVFTMVLSTREQHIRKEKATSNICSNQAFLATLAGASLLARGEKGFSESCLSGKEKAYTFAKRVAKLKGVEIAFPKAHFFNECTLELSVPINALVAKGQEFGLQIGTNVSERIDNGKRNLLKVSFSDLQSEEACEKLAEFFEKQFETQNKEVKLHSIPKKDSRHTSVNLPEISIDKIKAYYQQLGNMNIGPEAACYPLGSCTMKYNPYINDWAANLPGFTNIHPQAPLEDTQGCLEILYQIQEWFKKITGLAAVTTQPVAGAQGELVSLKLFQAYHNENKQGHRSKVFIPKSAHGTNFATAVTAGYHESDIVLLQANELGQIDEADLDEKLKLFGSKLAAVMITNPNTSGIFEARFKNIADKIHNAGGLVFMDGANLNAIAGWVDLNKLGVDAMHSNLHKTWSIPHGGGGPGDAIVAVNEKLADYLPGFQIIKEDNTYTTKKPAKSIGSVHRHWGNFAHKVRCYAYLKRLGKAGVPHMSSIAVLSARYLYQKLKGDYPILPNKTDNIARMHEFIITLPEKDFELLEKADIAKSAAIPRIGKLFLDFGYHAPTVAFPETLGLMIEPTESYTKDELDRFAEASIAILKVVRNTPSYLNKTPQATPIDRVDEVSANRNLVLSEKLEDLPPIYEDRIDRSLLKMKSINEISSDILSGSID